MLAAIAKKLEDISLQLEEIKRLLPRLTLFKYRENGVEKQEIVVRDSYGNYFDANQLHYGSIKEMEADIYRVPPPEEIQVIPNLNSNICNGDKE